MKKTFFNQESEDMYLTLPWGLAEQVIKSMKKNPNTCIHLITHGFDNGVLKTTIKYHIGFND
jgi:hypothetical protein